MKIPPRTTFVGKYLYLMLIQLFHTLVDFGRNVVQMLAIFVGSVAQLGAKKAIVSWIPDLCTPDQKSLLTCPLAGVMFEASVIW